MAVKFQTYLDGKLYHYGEDDAERYLGIDPDYRAVDYMKDKNNLILFDQPSTNYKTGKQLSDEIVKLLDRMERYARHKDLILDVKAIAISHKVAPKISYRVTEGAKRPPSVPREMFLNLKIHGLGQYKQLITRTGHPFHDFTNLNSVGNFAILFTLEGIDGIARPSVGFDDPAFQWDSFDRVRKYLNTGIFRFENALKTRPVGETPNERFYELIIDGLVSLNKFIDTATNDKMPFPFQQNSNFQTLISAYKERQFQDMLRMLSRGYEDSRIAGAIEKFLKSMVPLLDDMDYIKENPSDEDRWKSIKFTGDGYLSKFIDDLNYLKNFAMRYYNRGGELTQPAIEEYENILQRAIDRVDSEVVSPEIGDGLLAIDKLLQEYIRTKNIGLWRGIWNEATDIRDVYGEELRRLTP